MARARRLLPYLILLAALVIFGLYLAANADRYRALLDLSVAGIFYLILLSLLFWVVNGLINTLFYRGLNTPVTLHEGLGLAAVNTLANQLPFAGGLVAKGIYLKQRYRLTYARYLSATAALYVCFVAANGALGLFVLGYMQWRGATVPAILWAGFALMTAVLATLWLPPRPGWIPTRWRQRSAQLVEGWGILGRNGQLVRQLTGLQIVMTALFAARFWLAFHMLSQPVSYADCLLFAAATVLSRLVSLAPGGLGVREGIVGAMAAILGFDVGASVVAVGLERLVSTLVVIIVGVIYSYLLSRAAVASQPSERAES